jgi:hypothetical protein
VSAPGRAERSVQLNLHRARGREQSGFAQAVCELEGPMPILNSSKTLMAKKNEPFQ